MSDGNRAFLVALGLALVAGVALRATRAGAALDPEGAPMGEARAEAFGGKCGGIFDGIFGCNGGTLSIAQVKALVEDTVRRWTPGVDPLMLRAIIEIESGRDPSAFRWEPHVQDASIGLCQTLYATVDFLVNTWGARAFGQPTVQDLFRPEVSVYFGANYLEYLMRLGGGGHTEEWIVRAYNGGPGGAAEPYTATYWSRYLDAKRRLMGLGG